MVTLPVTAPEELPMKKLLMTVAIGFMTATVLASNALAFANDTPQCPKNYWKHGRYVCDIANNS